VTLSDEETCEVGVWFGDVLKQCDSYLSRVILTEDTGKGPPRNTFHFLCILVEKFAACCNIDS